MKNIFLPVFIILFTIISHETVAQIITSSSGDTIKVIKPNGDVEDNYGEKLGHFESDGKIYNRINELLGKAESGKIYDLQLNEIASIDANGYITDYNNETIGRAYNGQITDVQNNFLGSYSNVDPEKAVILLLIIFL